MFAKAIIHFKPLRDNGNVRCLNGSAHRHVSNDLKQVTCPLCLKSDTNKEYWKQARYWSLNKQYYSPITGEKFERYKN
jgi:hypothetical protein